MSRKKEVTFPRKKRLKKIFLTPKPICNEIEIFSEAVIFPDLDAKIIFNSTKSFFLTLTTHLCTYVGGYVLI
jgi:hypothetical protein